MKDVRRLAGMSTVCGIAIAMLVNFSGLAIFAYFHAHPQMMDPGMANDQVMPLYVVQALPSGIAGLIIAGLFAASLSTLAGSMNSVATLVGEDFYRRISRNPTDRSRLAVMKVTSVLVGCFGTGLAYIMGHMEIDSLFKIWNQIVAMLGGGFAGIYILGMFTRRTSSIGAVAGAIGSIVGTVLVKQYTGLHWIFYSPFAVFACVALGYVTSLVFPSKREKNIAGLTVFDAVKADDESR
jgi:Na+/proline symporter